MFLSRRVALWPPSSGFRTMDSTIAARRRLASAGFFAATFSMFSRAATSRATVTFGVSGVAGRLGAVTRAKDWRARSLASSVLSFRASGSE